MSSNGINLHCIKKDEFELLANAIKVGDLHEYYMDQQVKIRKGTSDFAVAKQIFLNDEYGIALPFEPYTIIDAGANVGYAALYFAARYQYATILAVECDSANFQAMMHNLNGGPGTDQPHPRIIPIMAALWPVDTEIAVIDPGRKEWAMRVVTQLEEGVAIFRNNAPGLSLKSLLRAACSGNEAGVVDILKIDIEGSELELFSSAETVSTIQAQVRCVIVETHDRFRPGSYAAVNQALKGWPKSRVGENQVFLNPAFPQ